MKTTTDDGCRGETVQLLENVYGKLQTLGRTPVAYLRLKLSVVRFLSSSAVWYFSYRVQCKLVYSQGMHLLIKIVKFNFQIQIGTHL